MSKCRLSGQKPQFGNSVPWSKKKTRRAWQPNVQKYSIFDPESGRSVTIKASAKTMRSVEKMGLQAYLRKRNLRLRDVV